MSASDRMKALNERMKTDPILKGRNRSGIRKTRQTPEYRAKQAEVMRQRWRDPVTGQRLREGVKANADRINGDDEIRRRQWAGRRGWRIPDDLEPLYQKLRRKVGAVEALRMVRDQAKRGAP